MSTSVSSKRSTKRRLPLPLAVAVVLAMVLAVIAWVLGPGHVLRLSPQGYVDRALAMMDNGYDAQGPSWEAAKAQARNLTKGATTYSETYPALTMALAQAGGSHSQFFEPGQSTATKIPDRPLPSSSQDGSIEILALPLLVSDQESFQQQYADAAAAAVSGANHCGYILDLRGNQGGNPYPMLAGVAALLPDGAALSYQDRTGQQSPVLVTGGSITRDGKTLSHSNAGPKLTKPVAVLTDSHTASAAEAVALAFRGLPYARSFGTWTKGVSSHNELKTLPDGASMALTVAIDVDRTGRTFNGQSIPADQDDGPRAVTDAKTWLATQGC